MKIGLRKLVIYSFTTLLIADSLDYLAGVQAINFNPAFVTASLKIVSLYCLFVYQRKNNWKKEIPKPAVNLFTWLIFWNAVTVIRGALSARDYWDWRFLGLSSFFYFFIPYAMVIGVMFYSNAHLFKWILKKVYVYSFVALPLTLFGFLLYSRIIISVWMYILLSVYLKKSWRLIILFAGFCSIITGYEIRANVLRIGVAVLLMMIYFLRRFISAAWLKILCGLLLMAPFILIFLGFTGKFNVFQPFEDNDEIFVVGEGEKASTNLAQDTRTGLYQEIFASIHDNVSLVFGGGATAKYESRIIIEANNDRGRYRSEVGFLNTILYSGIVGVVLYFLILCYAAYYALNRSNNFFSKILAVFLAFRWVLFFVEDITMYDMNFYFLWIAIGICFSNQFRNQTDYQIKGWVTRYVQG